MTHEKQTVTITLDLTVAQLALLVLRNAEDEQIGDIDFDRFEPDLSIRQAYMKAYHEYNGDPEEFEADLLHPQARTFRYVNPNHTLGMLYTQLYQAIEALGIPVRAQTFEDDLS